MNKILTGIVSLIIFTLITLLAPSHYTYADQFDCHTFGTKTCITLHATATCTSGKPVVTLTWNNPGNNSTFNIVYSHDGHWYMKPILSKTLSTTIPAYGAWKDGGTSSNKDPGFLATGGGFGAKITGGAPGSVGGSGIITGYSTPDVSPAGGLPNCTVPTATPTLTVTPTPTTPPAHTTLNVALQLPGIGQKGNLSPQHKTRTLHVSIYAADADPTQPNVTPVFDSKTLQVKYDSGTGYFTNDSLDVGDLPTGDYQILFKSPGYLRKEVVNTTDQTTKIHITAATTNQIPSTKLIAGDVNTLYNVMDISDFYALVGCYKDKASTSSCSAGAQMADLNDDGVVDGIDLNYWLLGMSDLSQTNSTNPGAGDGITGD